MLLVPFLRTKKRTRKTLAPKLVTYLKKLRFIMIVSPPFLPLIVSQQVCLPNPSNAAAAIPLSLSAVSHIFRIYIPNRIALPLIVLFLKNIVRAKDSDITFQSSDQHIFKVHFINIGTQSTGFPSPELLPSTEPIRLSEKGSTLELLFQFLYPEPHPDLASVEFDTLEPLAYAAEKYKVFSAINICKIRMQG